MISLKRVPLPGSRSSINKFVAELGTDVGVVSINSPPVNSLTPALISGLRNTIAEARKDRSLAGLIIQSEVASVFSAGLDLSYVRVKAGEPNARLRLKEYFESFQQVLKWVLLSILDMLSLLEISFCLIGLLRQWYPEQLLPEVLCLPFFATTGIDNAS